MKWKIKRKYLISCLTSTAFLFTAILVTAARPVSRNMTDIDGDGVIDTLTITWKFGSKYGKNLVIETSGGRFVYAMEELKPSKVQTADVDGDGQLEISVIVYKKTRLDPEYKERPFFYNWHQDGLSPKWLGSALSRPFKDIIFADINGDGAEELIAIEISNNGSELVNAYKWSGFGFAGMAQSKEFDLIYDITKGGSDAEKGYHINAKIKSAQGQKWVVLEYDMDNRLLSDENIAN